MLKLANVSAAYGSVPAISNVSANFRRAGSLSGCASTAFR